MNEPTAPLPNDDEKSLHVFREVVSTLAQSLTEPTAAPPLDREQTLSILRSGLSHAEFTRVKPTILALYEAAALIESLRAECGLRQIYGYEEGKKAAQRDGIPRAGYIRELTPDEEANLVAALTNGPSGPLHVIAAAGIARDDARWKDAMQTVRREAYDNWVISFDRVNELFIAAMTKESGEQKSGKE